MSETSLSLENIKQSILIYKEPFTANIISSFDELKQIALTQELNREVDLLVSLLEKSEEECKRDFLKRCQERENDHENSLSLNSPTVINDIYIFVAKNLFNPQNYQELLKILSPNTRKILSIDKSYIPSFYKDKVDELYPQQIHDWPAKIREQNIAVLHDKKIEPGIDLTNFVFSDDAIFDCRDLLDIPIGSISTIFYQLEDQHPLLYKKIITHNQDLINLHEDIIHYRQLRTEQKKLPTVKEAIESLIIDLNTITTKTKSEEIITEKFLERIASFLKYVEILPEEIKKELRELKILDYDILSSIHEALKIKGVCINKNVVTLKQKLATILSQSITKVFLHVDPSANEQEVSRLKYKYTKKFTTQKELQAPTYNALKLALKKAKIYSINFSKILVHLPVSLYSTAFAKIGKLDRESLNSLLVSINAGKYNEEQQKFIAQMMVDGIRKQKYSYMDIPKDLQKSNVLRYVLEQLSKEELQTYTQSTHPYYLLELCSASPDLFSRILVNESPQVIFNIFRYSYQQQNKSPIYDYATNHTDILKEILANLSEEQLVNLLENYLSVNARDTIEPTHSPYLRSLLNGLSINNFVKSMSFRNSRGTTLAYLILEDTQLFQEVLDKFPEDKLVDLITNKSCHNKTILQKVVRYPTLFRQLIDKLPQKDLFKAITAGEGGGAIIVSLDDSDLACFLLGKVSKRVLYDLIFIKNNQGKTLLELSLSQPKVFKYIISNLPEENRVKALIITNQRSDGKVLADLLSKKELLQFTLSQIPDNCLMDLLTTNKQEVPFLHELPYTDINLTTETLRRLPAKDKSRAFKLQSSNRKVFLASVLNCSSLVQMALDAISDEGILKLVCYTDDWGDSVLSQSIETYPKIYKAILKKLPSNKIQQLLSHSYYNTYFELLFIKPKLYNYTLSRLSQNDIFSLLQRTANSPSPAIYTLAYSHLELFENTLKALNPTDIVSVLSIKKHPEDKNICAYSDAAIKIISQYVAPAEINKVITNKAELKLYQNERVYWLGSLLCENKTHNFEDLKTHGVTEHELIKLIGQNALIIGNSPTMQALPGYYLLAGNSSKHAFFSKRIDIKHAELALTKLEETLNDRIKRFKNLSQYPELAAALENFVSQYQASDKNIACTLTLQNNIKSTIKTHIPAIRAKDDYKALRIVTDILMLVTVIPMLLKLLISTQKEVGFFGKSREEISLNRIESSVEKLGTVDNYPRNYT